MSFLKKSSVYLISNILNASIPFILLPILTRYLTTSEYGKIAIFQTIITGLVSVIAFNTLGATARVFFDKKDEHYLKNYNGACFCLLILSLAIIIPLTFIFSRGLVFFTGIDRNWILAAIFISGINFVVQFRLNQWQITEKAISFGLLQIGQSLLLFIFTLIFVVFLARHAEGRIEAQMYSMMIIFVITILLIQKDKLLSFRNIKKGMFLDALSFSVPLIPHVFGMYLISSVDRFFINSKLGSDQAGIYMVAMQLSMGMVIVFDAVNKAFMPWLFKELSNSSFIQRKHIVSKTYYYFILLIFIGILSFLISPYVLTLIAGEKYKAGKLVIGWLCLGQVFLGMYLMVTNYLFYAKKTGQLSVLTIACGVFNVILLLCLIAPLGIEGVAISFAVSMLLRFLGTWFLAYKTKLVPWTLGNV
ncbi:lipopolysaccharide biosynthesis protein [Enterobacter ludwigii]|uniref:lipopolysaccharide biosynthesis protein n=1 Tax=Enterobacter ludwigii TaxID=299767 RepID=UPI001D17AE11|nr:oligosaccharide flippase family protein [Enterobacter ludwigii]UEG31722.1 oligosaccharide flippase family protein [Enterobacter ludwigii]UEG39370.1 oligosaccharide flippase family protein [Enterobacter ludwigii]